MKLWPLLILGFTSIASVAGSTTWHVTYDPGSAVDRIGQVVLQAASGDTIVVDPGTYYEHIDLQGKSMTILAPGGSQVTILDGSQAITGRNGSIIYAGPMGSARVVVTGFTLRNGSGGHDEENQGAGGAICVWNHTWSAGGFFEVRDSSFLDNTVTAPAIARHGGAIFFASLDSTLIVNCFFEGNSIRDYGGSVCLVSARLHTIRDSQFVIGQSTGNSALYLVNSGTTEVLHNTFTSEVDHSRCIVSESNDLHLVGNEFIARHSSMASSLSLTGGLGWGGDVSQLEVRDNRFYAERQNSAAVVSMVFDGGTITFAGNTLVGCEVEAEVRSGTPLVFSNNLLFNTPVNILSYVGGSVVCNDVWLGAISDALGTLSLDRNVAQDPLFCDLTSVSFEVSAVSICATDNSPEGCGWIGAGRIGCGGTAVRAATWGQIKGMFR